MRIFIIAGEVSADEHGAYLARVLKKERPECELYGIGGERMEEAGVRVTGNLISLNNFQFRYFPRLFSRSALKGLIADYETFLRENRCDAVVMIGLAEDAHYFTLRVARTATSLGIPVVYYFSPHVWIWSGRKTRKISEYFDLVLTFFPREERAYRDAGAETGYIGHPMLDEIGEGGDVIEARSRSGARRAGLPGRVVYFPGSRPGEIKQHMPIVNALIAGMEAEGEYEHTVSALPGLRDAIDGYLAGLGPDRVRVVEGNVYDLIKGADFIFASSGTISLEIAILGTPFAIFYRLPRLTYIVGRCFIRFDYFGLPNLIMGKPVVPEFLQSKINVGELVRLAVRSMEDPEYRESCRSNFDALKKELGRPGAVRRAALRIIGLAEAHAGEENG